MILRAFILVLGLIAVTACGRVGPLEPPPPRDGQERTTQQQPQENQERPSTGRRFFLDGIL